MTVSLGIDWPDGNFEDVLIGGYREVSERWCALGKELGLSWIPRFQSWVSIDNEHVDEVLKELRTFRSAVLRKWPGDQFTLQRVDGLIEALEKLKRSSGWKAAIG